MRVLDASSIIHAWDEYPLEKFEKLWKWIGDEIHGGVLQIPSVAYDEVAIMSPECCAWLKAAEIAKIEITEQILHLALSFKALIGVVDEKYHPKGVDENDLLIIAAARAHDAQLITNEARQPGSPVLLPKRKIPAVCSIAHVGVDCINFRDYFMSSPHKF